MRLRALTYAVVAVLSVVCPSLVAAQAPDTANVRPVRVTIVTNAPQTVPVQPVTQDVSQEPFLRGSRNAVSFSFDGFDLGKIDGGVGGKHWFSTTSALRASLDFFVEATEGDVVGQQTNGRSAIGVGISAVAERHTSRLEAIERVSPYLAGGFRFAASGFSENTKFPLANSVQRTENDGNELDFRVLVGFGVEYRLSRRLSLAGEHTFGASIVRTNRDALQVFNDGTRITTERNDRVFRLGTDTSRLILSVYF